jgi:hypothetical protein
MWRRLEQLFLQGEELVSRFEDVFDELVAISVVSGSPLQS